MEKNMEKSFSSTKERPPLSYVYLIAEAILSSETKRLCVHDIYLYISEKYPFYNMNNEGWKNSVRHNLSINRSVFVKTPRNSFDGCEKKKGHYWSVDVTQSNILSNRKFRQRSTKNYSANLQNTSIRCINNRALDFKLTNFPQENLVTLQQEQTKYNSNKHFNESTLLEFQQKMSYYPDGSLVNWKTNSQVCPIYENRNGFTENSMFDDNNFEYDLFRHTQQHFEALPLQNTQINNSLVDSGLRNFSSESLIQ